MSKDLIDKEVLAAYERLADTLVGLVVECLDTMRANGLDAAAERIEATAREHNISIMRVDTTTPAGGRN
jgi:hypothetical protein